MKYPRVVIIGAGIGGLTAGAVLLKQGWDVTVLEAQVYPGGCAGTFFHKGYRFDAGATLAGGFNPGGPHMRVAEILGIQWPVWPVDPAWAVHLPDRTVTQWAQPERWREERRTHFPFAENFWQTQEKLADLSWDISSRHFPWPPVNLREKVELLQAARPDTLSALPYLARTMRDLLPAESTAEFKTFVDAQLLISAQAVSDQAGALYGAAALDLPRRGVNNTRGGIGSLADTLVEWIRAHGGTILFRQPVERLEIRDRRAVAALTSKGLRIEADVVLANLTPWGLRSLLGKQTPARLVQETEMREPTWGAFVLYAGLDASIVDTSVTHHQVVMDVNRPLGEGNSVFISLSPHEDPTRAPDGMRTATLTTHTSVLYWHGLLGKSQDQYEEMKAAYTGRMLAAAERALPGFKQASALLLPGTPVTYETFTRRPLGMVGGFPQRSLFSARGPQTGLDNVWLVGDSVFPGQSTAGVTLGALRVARTVSHAMERNRGYKAFFPDKKPAERVVVSGGSQESHRRVR